MKIGIVVTIAVAAAAVPSHRAQAQSDASGFAVITADAYEAIAEPARLGFGDPVFQPPASYDVFTNFGHGFDFRRPISGQGYDGHVDPLAGTCWAGYPYEPNPWHCLFRNSHSCCSGAHGSGCGGNLNYAYRPNCIWPFCLFGRNRISKGPVCDYDQGSGSSSINRQPSASHDRTPQEAGDVLLPVPPAPENPSDLPRVPEIEPPSAVNVQPDSSLDRTPDLVRPILPRVPAETTDESPIEVPANSIPRNALPVRPALRLRVPQQNSNGGVPSNALPPNARPTTNSNVPAVKLPGNSLPSNPLPIVPAIKLKPSSPTTAAGSQPNTEKSTAPGDAAKRLPANSLPRNSLPTNPTRVRPQTPETKESQLKVRRSGSADKPASKPAATTIPENELPITPPQAQKRPLNQQGSRLTVRAKSGQDAAAVIPPARTVARDDSARERPKRPRVAGVTIQAVPAKDEPHKAGRDTIRVARRIDATRSVLRQPETTLNPRETP